MVIVCNAGYVVLSILHTLMKAYGTSSSMRRREYLDLALCVIGPAATGVLIVLFGSTPVSSLGMTSAILLVYALRQRTCIYSDALTGLDNRRRVDECFESIREGLSAESPLRVYLCDVNRFKGINDTYGHVKGDAALVAVGRALRDVGGDLGGMVARDSRARDGGSPQRDARPRLRDGRPRVSRQAERGKRRLQLARALARRRHARGRPVALPAQARGQGGCRGMRYGFLYAYTYLCVNVFCAIVSLGFARNVTADMGTRPEVRCMRLILYTFAAYLGVDFLWELGESGLVPLLAGMQAAINVAACILICIIACWWALYAEMRLHRHLASMRGFQIVFVFPFAIMALLLVSSMVNNLSLASGDRLGSTWGDLYFIRFIVVVSYLALAAGHTLVAIPRAATSAKRGERLVILLFALALTFFAALDSLVPYLPFMSVGLMWTLIMVFVMLQRNRIFNDALTGLGNRRRMNEYLGKLLSVRREGGGHFLYMLDVNKFKRINDTYGHLEGDRALKLVALALSQTVDFHGGFAARWGGGRARARGPRDCRRLEPRRGPGVREREARPSCRRAGPSVRRRGLHGLHRHRGVGRRSERPHRPRGQDAQ